MMQRKSKDYSDIINLPHPVSKKHPQMSLYDRAAQFSPFSALTGHEAAIAETGRLTEERTELDEDAKERLDEKLGYPTPISYEDWVKANHYQEIRPADAKWLYRQELGYIESMKDITLKELAEQRIGEFTDALRKYILD